MSSDTSKQSTKAQGKRTFRQHRLKTPATKPIPLLKPKLTRTGKDAHAPDTSDLYIINRAPPVTAVCKTKVIFYDAQGFQYYNAENQKITTNLNWCQELHEKAWFEEKRDRIFIIRKKVTTEENVIIWPQADANRRVELLTVNGAVVATGILFHSGADVPLGVKKRSTNVVVLRDILYSTS